MNKARNIVNKCVEAFSVFLMVVMVLLVLWRSLSAKRTTLSSIEGQ